MGKKTPFVCRNHKLLILSRHLHIYPFIMPEMFSDAYFCSAYDVIIFLFVSISLLKATMAQVIIFLTLSDKASSFSVKKHRFFILQKCNEGGSC